MPLAIKSLWQLEYHHPASFARFRKQRVIQCLIKQTSCKPVLPVALEASPNTFSQNKDWATSLSLVILGEHLQGKWPAGKLFDWWHPVHVPIFPSLMLRSFACFTNVPFQTDWMPKESTRWCAFRFDFDWLKKSGRNCQMQQASAKYPQLPGTKLLLRSQMI